MSTTRTQLKHQTYLAMAQQLSGLSSCLRLQVGCILLRMDGSVAGVGYNGALPHKPHCTPETCNPSVRCYRTRHAERSALDYSSGDIAIAYTTHEPCLRCTQDLIARGCREVYYLIWQRTLPRPPLARSMCANRVCAGRGPIQTEARERGIRRTV